MELRTPEECITYVARELDRLVKSHAGWHAGRSVVMDDPPLSWKVGLDRAIPYWYLLEARLNEQEFLIWFGCYEVGAPWLHWLMRPAVHVAFDQLMPSKDPLLNRFTLKDVLSAMITSVDDPTRLTEVPFPPNTFSDTMTSWRPRA